MLAEPSATRKNLSISRFFSTLMLVYMAATVLMVLLRDILEPISSAFACVINFFPLWFIPAFPLGLLSLLINRRSGWRLLLPFVPLILGGLIYWRWFVPPSLRTGENGGGQGDSLSILSHNISSKTYDFQSTSQFLQAQNADILFLQEIHMNTRGVSVLAEALRADHPYAAVQSIDDDLRANMILSRYPILITESINELKSQYARLCVNGLAVDVYNISLDTPIKGEQYSGGLFSYMLPYDPQTRNVQIAHLLDRLEQQTDPLIVAGDFNLSDQSVYYRTIADRLIDSYASVGMGTGFTYPASTAFRVPIPQFLPPLLRIDYVWHNDAFVATAAELRPGVQSDHLAIFTQLAWNANAARTSCDPAAGASH